MPRRTTATATAVVVAWGLAACSNLEPRVGSACLAVDPSVVNQIQSQARPGVDLSGFVAVKAETSQWEQVFFISARAGERIATWVADEITVVRRGPLPGWEPIILTANGAAQAATPRLRSNTAEDLYRPGAGSVAGMASQACLRHAQPRP